MISTYGRVGPCYLLDWEGGESGRKVPGRSCRPTSLEILVRNLAGLQTEVGPFAEGFQPHDSREVQSIMAGTGKKRKYDDDLGSEKKKKKVSADSTASPKSSKKIKVSSVVQAQVSPPVIGTL